MKDEGKTTKQFIEKPVNLLDRIAEMEKIKTGRKRVRWSATKIQDVEGAAKNIPGLKISEQQSFEARKMEVMGRLAGGIAHDLNNVLGAIVGYAELAAHDKDDAIRRKHIDEVLKASERAKELVGRIIAFSRRTEQGKTSRGESLIAKEELNLHGRERILFVDDDKDLAELAQQILEGFGYHVTIRTSSMEAIKTFMDTPDAFDLVITDMTMPHMTGGDLVQELIRARPDIPVILCTGFSEHMTEEEAMQLGIKAFMMKPLTRKSMAKVIRDVLDQMK